MDSRHKATPPMMPPTPPRKKRRIRLWVIGIVVVLAVIIGIANGGNSSNTATTSTSTASQTTSAPTTAPTQQSVHYPPKTGADLRGLAAKGDASAIHEIHSESVGLIGVCPQPKRKVTVDPGVTDQQLAEDLLAYFYGQQLDSPCGQYCSNKSNARTNSTEKPILLAEKLSHISTEPTSTDELFHTDSPYLNSIGPCGSVVFAYRTQAEVNDPNSTGYTAGRILLDVIDSSGASNYDPNASNLTYMVTLDVGGNFTGQEYVVMY